MSAIIKCEKCGTEVGPVSIDAKYCPSCYSSAYSDFLKSKIKTAQSHGFEPAAFTVPAFDWQKDVIRFGCERGAAALFVECGLGKTIMQLEWANQVYQRTARNVLILAPLAVSPQTVAEGKRFGVNVTHCRAQSDVMPGVNITNYERLDKFDCPTFAGVVLDESSILKAFNGKTRARLNEAFKDTQFKLCCTATPAPNDYTELGQHAEFLGICTPAQMLATYFVNDTFDTGTWRLKGHAVNAFWEWVATWAACVSRPSDLGYADDGYVLPPLNIITDSVAVDVTKDRRDNELFRDPSFSATDMHHEMRLTCDDRAKRCAEIVASKPDDVWTIWCNTNYEADALAKAIPHAIEIRGSDKAEHKEHSLNAFTDGAFNVLITKPDIAGMGLNWQHCHNTIFCGLSYSFESLYQALRRHYRFGQKHPVNAYIVQAETEGPILAVVKEKMTKHETMKEQMRAAARALLTKKNTINMKETIDTKTGENWTLHHGDCVRVATEKLADESVDFSIFSPPFADLFTYSDDVQDMGNCAGLEDFMIQFGFLIDQLHRVLKPGREIAVHCCDLLATKWKDGDIEYKNFSDAIYRAFHERGFLFHSRICIWKDPVTEMQRTKAHGLLYKTLKADSSKSRVGSADYLLVFRKRGENPRPITHDESELPLDLWQRLASPVWMNIDQGNVLNGKCATESQDERHICPLQLGVIDNALTLWSMKDDLVFSPFTGIGSEGYCALRKGRRFVGAELKASYFKSACENLALANSEPELFNLA